ncbi:MAG: hypothetical protein KatS3mg119_0534 [Rhodothalassiaceae bacterium]|nr:MAG: hypothetical protein KatS3mg119_0534 [Rhodothalassiaceae bacterium]
MRRTDLPFAFAGTALRREEALAAEAARTGPGDADLLLLLDGKGRAAFHEGEGRILRLAVALAKTWAGDPAGWVLLGRDEAGRRHWAALVEDDALAGLADAAAGAVWADPRGIAHRLTMTAAAGGPPDRDSGDLAAARALLFWHRDNRFCSSCAGRMRAVRAGLARLCGSCGREIYPRVDPAVLVLVHAGDACVLARGRSFPPGMVSTIAGFVLPGETPEQAAARETAEELGLAAAAPARLVASQPWPFPHSLMLGLLQEVRDGPLAIDETELASARWFRRAETIRLLEEARAGRRGELFVPPPLALAHHLIALWARDS